MSAATRSPLRLPDGGAVLTLQVDSGLKPGRYLVDVDAGNRMIAVAIGRATELGDLYRTFVNLLNELKSPPTVQP